MFLDTLVMALGFYMLVPLLAFYMLEDLGFSAALAGIVNGVRSAGQQGLMLWSGVTADRIGYRAAICAGVTIRAVGFAAFGVADTPAALVVAAAVAGVGGSLFHPASYAAYGTLTSAEHRVTVYSVRELLNNFGFIAGPVVGALLTRIDFRLTCFVAAGLFLGAGILSWFGLRRLSDRAPAGAGSQLRRSTVRGALRAARSNRSFLRFTALTAGGWVLFSQLYLAVPYQATRVLDDPLELGTVYSAAAAVMVVTMVPTVRAVDRRLASPHAMSLATVLMTVGLVVVGLATVPALYAGVILISLGHAVFMPILNGVVSRNAPDGLTASFFGINGLALAVGGVVGNLGGGAVLDIGSGWLAWACFAIWGGVVAAMFARGH